jgi:hypothetical protein
MADDGVRTHVGILRAARQGKELLSCLRVPRRARYPASTLLEIRTPTCVSFSRSPSLALLALLLFAPLVLWSCGGSGEHAKLDEGQSGHVAATGSDGAPAAEMSSSPEPVLQDMEVEESFELGRRARPAANTAGAAIDEQRQAEGSTDKAEKSAAKKTPSQTWKRSQVLPHQSRLEVGDKEELPQEALQVKVRVDGFRARVLLDGYYRNDRAEQLEGTFQLRLPSGATPWYLAFGKIERKAAEPVVIGDVLYSAEEARRMGLMPEDVLADRAERWSEPQRGEDAPAPQGGACLRRDGASPSRPGADGVVRRGCLHDARLPARARAAAPHRARL